MVKITDRESIIRFMEHTGIKESYPIPSTIYFSMMEGVYVIGLVIGYRTHKLVWKDSVLEERQRYFYNKDHESFKKKTLQEAGF